MACKRFRRQSPVRNSCFLSSLGLGLILQFIGPWECRFLLGVSRSWRRIVQRWIVNEFSFVESASLLRPAVRIQSKVHSQEMHAVMANDGRHILVTRGTQGQILQCDKQNSSSWRSVYSIENGVAEFLAAGQLFLLQRAVQERSKEVFFTNDWKRKPLRIAPNLVDVQPIGVDDEAKSMIALYTPFSNSIHCEMRIIKVELVSGTVQDTNIRLQSGSKFIFERVIVRDEIPATRIVICRETQDFHRRNVYKSPIYVADELKSKDMVALTFSELAHLVSPCGRWLSCGCWLTNCNFGVTEQWFTASLFDLDASNDSARRINFSDCQSNSIVSSFSSDGNYLLLGWRRRRCSFPWESMDIFDVQKLFSLARKSCNVIKPLCRFTRDLCLSGDPNTRLAVTWAGQYVLMAEVSGISILDPHQNGALMAVIRSSELAKSLPGASHSRILNIYCAGRVALYWLPTNRQSTTGSLLLFELLTSKVLLTISTRIPFCESLGESVFVSDDCTAVSVKCPDNSIRIFDSHSAKEKTFII